MANIDGTNERYGFLQKHEAHFAPVNEDYNFSHYIFLHDMDLFCVKVQVCRIRAHHVRPDFSGLANFAAIVMLATRKILYYLISIIIKQLQLLLVCFKGLNFGHLCIIEHIINMFLCFDLLLPFFVEIFLFLFGTLCNFDLHWLGAVWLDAL